MPMTLFIANKAYSSWSMRPWLLMASMGIPFEEVVIPMARPDSKKKMLKQQSSWVTGIIIVQVLESKHYKIHYVL